MQPFKKDDTVKCITARDEKNLTWHKIYTVIKDEEPGIFASSPYVTVNGDNGSLACHASRFAIRSKSDAN